MNHRPTRNRLAALGIAVVVAGTVAACGGSSSPSTTASSSTSSAAAANVAGSTGDTGAASRRGALVSCLKKNGVTLPANAFGGRRFGATGASGRPGPGRGFFGASGPSGASGFGPGGGFPGGATGGRGALGGLLSNPKFAAAFAKCRGTVGFGPGGGFRGFGGTGATGFGATARTELTRFVACMRTNGENLPTPNLSGGGTIFAGVNQTTTAFKNAYAKCGSIITFLPGRAGAPPAAA